MRLRWKGGDGGKSLGDGLYVTTREEAPHSMVYRYTCRKA